MLLLRQKCKLNKTFKTTTQNIRALLVKAEALFNLCQFEHSMVHFHRGLVSDFDDVANNKQWKLHNMITANVIVCLLLSDLQKNLNCQFIIQFIIIITFNIVISA